MVARKIPRKYPYTVLGKYPYTVPNHSFWYRPVVVVSLRETLSSHVQPSCLLAVQRSFGSSDHFSQGLITRRVQRSFGAVSLPTLRVSRSEGPQHNLVCGDIGLASSG